MSGCWTCGGDSLSLGCGLIRDPEARWWQFWRTITCPVCLGTGRNDPPAMDPWGERYHDPVIVQRKVFVTEEVLRQFEEQSVILAKRGLCVSLTAETEEEAEALFDWLCNLREENSDDVQI